MRCLWICFFWLLQLKVEIESLTLWLFFLLKSLSKSPLSLIEIQNSRLRFQSFPVKLRSQFPPVCIKSFNTSEFLKDDSLTLSSRGWLQRCWMLQKVSRLSSGPLKNILLISSRMLTSGEVLLQLRVTQRHRKVFQSLLDSKVALASKRDGNNQRDQYCVIFHLYLFLFQECLSLK